MDPKIDELSTEELDCVSGGGLVGDASAALVAVAHAIFDGVNAGLNALGGSGGGSAGHAGGAPKSTWL